MASTVLRICLKFCLFFRKTCGVSPPHCVRRFFAERRLRCVHEERMVARLLPGRWRRVGFHGATRSQILGGAFPAHSFRYAAGNFPCQLSAESGVTHAGWWRATCPRDGHAGRVATSLLSQPLQRVCAPTSGTGKAGPSCATNRSAGRTALCPQRLHQQNMPIPSRSSSPSAIARRSRSSLARRRCFIRPISFGGPRYVPVRQVPGGELTGNGGKRT